MGQAGGSGQHSVLIGQTVIWRAAARHWGTAAAGGRI